MAEGGMERPGRMERSGSNSSMKVSGSSMGSRISDGAIEDLLSSSEALEQLPRVGCCDGPTDDRGIVQECDGQGAAARPAAEEGGPPAEDDWVRLSGGVDAMGLDSIPDELPVSRHAMGLDSIPDELPVSRQAMGAAQLGAAAAAGSTVRPPRAPPARRDESGALRCAFEEQHSSVAGRKGNVRVQERPFSRVKWVDLIQPPPPMCERCTSTVRKHWMGQTTSTSLCMAFCNYAARVQCRSERCSEWVSGSDCQRLGDFICEMCKQREETVARQKEIAARAGGAEAKDYTPDEPPTHYVFMYGDASEYRAMLHQRLTHSGSFAFWEACAEESPGHVFALSASQMAQLDGLFSGSGVRTAVTAIIYTSDGDAESLACTTYVASSPGAAAPTAAVGQGHTADATQPPRIEGGEEGMDAL